MTDEVFEGIDLANGGHNLGRCFICDNGSSLTVTFAEPISIIRTAIDCPFGTTEGFERLLHGEWPNEAPVDGFKSRKTELWLSDHVEDYQIVQRWRSRTPEERLHHPREPFFNSGGHIQPTLRMSIVPECLWYIANRFNKDLPVEERRRNLEEARRGEGKWIEAHPRIFLYSLIERLHQANPGNVDLNRLFHAARYKQESQYRGQLYQLVREQRAWMGNDMRSIQPPDMPNEFALSHHYFDSFLCALTAWAHHHGQCISWEEAGIDPMIVNIEGHILVLRQTGPG